MAFTTSLAERGIARSFFASAVALGLLTGAALADAYPNKQIRLVTPYPPGGSTDALARAIGPKLSEVLGQPVIIENLAGAGGTVGMANIAQSEPDGYTVVVTTVSPIAINPHTYPSMPYDVLKDFTAITNVATTESILATHPSFPGKTFEELVEIGKTREVKIAVSGAGSQPYIWLEKIKKDTGANIVPVPYTGGGPAVNDALGGHVDGVLNDIPAIIPLVESDRLNGMIVMNDKPASDFLPEVPTIAGRAELASYNASSWIMMLAPAGLPEEIGETLRKAVVEVMQDQPTVDTLKKVGLLPLVNESLAETKDFLTEEFNRFGAIVEETGVKVAN